MLLTCCPLVAFLNSDQRLLEQNEADSPGAGGFGASSKLKMSLGGSKKVTVGYSKLKVNDSKPKP